MFRRWGTLFLLIISAWFCQGQTTVKKVVLQGYWWDYWNNNYQNNWAGYLSELSPRLRAMGIDVVWVPPAYKNASTSSVGYSPFDHYDLGDKFQKGSTTTRLGNKDQVLQMVATLHANGVEVIQDIVLNHTDAAGSTNGSGGQDLFALNNYNDFSTSGYKNFRYVSYATPVNNNSASDYLNRSGRWAKNWTNFYPNTFNACCTNDINSVFWGPDISYESNAFGQSSCTGCYNPVQSTSYMRDNARNWMLWMMKQTGADGFRWDAVKHFGSDIVQDLSYNTKYLNGWANQGEAMMNIGEWVGGGAQLDTWVNSVTGANGGSEELIGTFDFGLRSALYGMATGNGFYNMASIPGAQQNRRVTFYVGSNTYVHRTAPFINLHDTFRPILSGTGNYTGWNTGQQLAPNLDPFNDRMITAYAIMFGMDGNPVVFFEDLFNIGNTGKRWTHRPDNVTDLPVRQPLVNLIWCHQNLDFKSGAYRVPSSDVAAEFWDAGFTNRNSGQQADVLVIERQGKAVIGTNDNGSAWKGCTINSGFVAGTVLSDYSGANTGTITVPANGRITIWVPPVDPANNLYGYCVWGPSGIQGAYVPARDSLTTQEWELDDDLGDSHCQSLQQGGALPAGACNQRIAGKVFVKGGRSVTFELFPSNNTQNLTVGAYGLDGAVLAEVSGTGSLTGTYTPQNDTWITLKARNTTAVNMGQKVWVKVTYQAPRDYDPLLFSAAETAAIWTGNGGDTNWGNCKNWEGAKRPNAFTDVYIPACATPYPRIFGAQAARNLYLETGAEIDVPINTRLEVRGDLTGGGRVIGCGHLRFNGSQAQLVEPGLNICLLEINNTNGVSLEGRDTVTQELRLTNGLAKLINQDLLLGANAQITGGSNLAYVQTPGGAAVGPSLICQVGSAQREFPVGNSSYNPVRLTNSGTLSFFHARVIDNVYVQGGSGAAVVRDTVVRRSWEISPETGGVNTRVEVQWRGVDQGLSFDQSSAFLAKSSGGSAYVKMPTSAPNSSGGDPATIYATGVTSFSYFAVGSEPITLPLVEEPVGEEIAAETGLVIAPNPFERMPQLRSSEAVWTDHIRLAVFSVQGKKLLQSEGALHDINNTLARMKNLPAGVYLINVENGLERKVFKVVKR
ncbi:MAG: alpha-amylase family glycosyl hydrolase [Bacteroidia bacterium]